MGIVSNRTVIIGRVFDIEYCHEGYNELYARLLVSSSNAYVIHAFGKTAKNIKGCISVGDTVHIEGRWLIPYKRVMAECISIVETFIPKEATKTA